MEYSVALFLDTEDMDEWEHNDKEVWSEENVPSTNTPEEDCVDEVHMQSISSQAKALSMWLIRFIFCLQVVYHISDNALAFCFKFLKVFFTVLGQFCKVSADIAGLIPSSLYQAKLSIKKPTFVRYVVCRKYHCIYYFSECFEGSQRCPQSKLCPFQRYPMHPQERMRRQCGTLLLKSIESVSGRIYLFPYLTYCYLGLKGVSRI